MAKKSRNPRRRGKNPNIPQSLTLAREVRAFELDQRGFSQKEIAAELSAEFGVRISQPAVCKALQRVHRETLAAMQGRVQLEKGRQVSRLEGIYLESMRSWRGSLEEGSKKSSKRVKKRTVPGQLPSDSGKPVTLPIDAGSEEETRLEKLSKHGEPRFLEVARGALSDIRHVLGLNAPAKSISLDLPPADPLEELSEEALDRELAAAAARLEAMTAPKKTPGGKK